MILVTGSKGQLGTMLAPLLPGAIFVDVDELDICDASAVREFVKARGVTAVVNCAAYTAVDAAEDDVETAERVNVQGVLNLAEAVEKIVHISTDYVFDGTAQQPYTETDEPHPASVYGATKRRGELAALEAGRTVTVIRTSWLYSPHGKNFFKTMLRFGAERESISVVNDQVGSPTYAGDLAEAIVAALHGMREGSKEIYHYSNEGVCSWCEFATEIMRQSQLPCRVLPITTSEYPTKARRPAYSVLSKAKIKKALDIEIPTWQDGLARCLAAARRTF